MERIGKFVICLVVAPIVSIVLVVLAVVVLALPLVALVAPQKVKFNN